MIDMDTRQPLSMDFLASLSAVEREALFETCARMRFSEGEMLMREGESLDFLYLVVAGEVEIIKSRGTTDERMLGVRGTGTLLGEMSLFRADHMHTASVCALDEVEALQMTRAQFEALVQRFPTLVYSLLRLVSQRLTESENVTISELREKNRQLTEAYQELQLAQAQLVEKERLEREMELARQIQRGILPASMPEQSGYEFGALMLPARAVGGDFYDLIELGDERLGIVLGDVSDKGVPAALIMSMTHTLVRVEAGINPSPRQVVTNVNQHLTRFCRARMFVTLLYGILDCRSGSFHYVRAGHPPPVLCSQSDAPRPLEIEAGQLLGILDEPALDEQQVNLPAGGSLFIYSDGITEATNPQGEQLGETGLLQVLSRLVGASAQDTCTGLVEAVMAHTGPGLQQDDITLICLQRR